MNISEQLLWMTKYYLTTSKIFLTLTKKVLHILKIKQNIKISQNMFENTMSKTGNERRFGS